MFKSLRVQNFRRLKDVTLDPLARVNLITGMNNSGKTSLLEALFLLLGPNNPELAIHINAIRGMDQIPVETETFWGWLFFEKGTAESFVVSGTREQGGAVALKVRREPSRRTTIGYKKEGAVSRPLPSQFAGSGSTQSGATDLFLEFTDEQGKVYESSISIANNEVIRAAIPPLPIGIYVNSKRVGGKKDDVERFGSLDRKGRLSELVELLKILEPRLQRLSLVPVMGEPLIHAGIAGLGELIPLAFAGEGMVRLCTIALTILNASGGTVLVDEIESGLHHSVMEKVWGGLAEFSKMQKVQLFATTHSWECIQAAAAAFPGGQDDGLALFRLELRDQDLRAVHLNGRTILDAVDMNLEVR